jgi:hypothetical protein
MIVDLKPHELDAIHELVLNVRAIAPVLAPDTPFGFKLLNLAQMVEDIASRAETGADHEGQAVAL